MWTTEEPCCTMLCLVLVTLFTVFHRSVFVSSRQQQYQFKGVGFDQPSLPPSNFTNMIFRRRREGRASSNEVSCKESTIEQNVTLKGGLEAGYFRKLAQHVAMRLCVELCCEEKGCDVAFMWGKNCYGVQCFTHELCDVIPASKNKVSGSLMVSHVTFHGQKASKQRKQPEQCTSTQVQPGVTLRGGLKSGNFTHIGRVMNLKTCINRCCTSNRCDIALVVNDQCFAVSCYSTELCEMTKALTKTYKPQLAYVQRPGTTQNKQNVSGLNIGPGDPAENQLICKNSQLFVNTTLKGGYHAGNYTNFGKVRDMPECIRLCCGNRNCDAALMLENNCFSVSCKDADNCLPVHAKSTQALAALNPRVSYITSRSEEVQFEKQETPEGICYAGIVSYDVSLRGGSAAGNFTPHGKVNNMQACISKCCATKGCDVAIMLRKLCYSVACKNERSCEKRQTPTGSTFNARIVYVFKDKTIKNKDSSEDENSQRRQKFKAGPTTAASTLPYQPIQISHPTKMAAYQREHFATYSKPLRTSQTNTSIEKLTSRQATVHVFRPTLKSTQLNRGTFSEGNSIAPASDFLQKTNSQESRNFVLEGRNHKHNGRIKAVANSDKENSFLLNFLRNNSNFMYGNQDNISVNHITVAPTIKDRIAMYPLTTEDRAKEQNGGHNSDDQLHTILANGFVNSKPDIDKQNRLDDLVSLETEEENDVEISQKSTILNSTTKDSMNSYLDHPDETMFGRGNSNLTQACELQEDKSENLDYTNFNSCNRTIPSLDNRDEVLIDHSQEQNKELQTRNEENNTVTKKTNETNYFFVTPLLSQLAANHKIMDSNDPTCTYSDILRNVTLRGNLRSGKFTDRGHMDNIKQCAKLCCMLKGCDLAFMLFNTCFTVECLNAQLCEPVPAKSIVDTPTLCYILVKTA